MRQRCSRRVTPGQARPQSGRETKASGRQQRQHDDPERHGLQKNQARGDGSGVCVKTRGEAREQPLFSGSRIWKMCKKRSMILTPHASLKREKEKGAPSASASISRIAEGDRSPPFVITSFRGPVPQTPLANIGQPRRCTHIG